MTIFKNIVTCWKLSREYGIPIGFRIFGTSRATKYQSIWTDEITGEKVSISLKHLCSVDSFLPTVYHELGHLLHEKGYEDDTMTSELAAWQWAIENMPSITCKQFGYMSFCFSTYWATEDVQKRLYFSELFIKMMRDRIKE